jgi:hypothetical protein
MIKRLSFVAAAALMATASAYADMADVAEDNPGASIAVVSVSANNFGNSLQGWNSVNTTELMWSRLNAMLEHTEEVLRQEWNVIPASTFANNPEFQALAGEQRDVGLPSYNDETMPLFSKDRRQLIRAEVDEDVARGLAVATGADFLMIVYSEWTVATGSFVPTSKALTKNVISIYDASGDQVFNDREDTMGARTLGAGGFVVVDDTTIDQWGDAYQAGFDVLYNKGRRRRRR